MGGIINVDESKCPPKLEDFLERGKDNVNLFGTWDNGFVYEYILPDAKLHLHISVDGI